jgi:hypothetical protein
MIIDAFFFLVVKIDKLCLILIMQKACNFLNIPAKELSLLKIQF